MSALRQVAVALDAQGHAEAVASTEVAACLQKRIGSGKFNKWFDTAQFALEADRLSVTVKNRFAASWITARFEADLRAIAEGLLGQPCCVVIRGQADQTDGSPRTHARHRKVVRQPVRRMQTAGEAQAADPSSGTAYSLHRYVVGDSNRVAYLSALQLADETGRPAISPLFIHSGCGLGKTHLLQGLCERYATRTRRPGAVRYLTAEQFTNDFVTAIRTSALDSFRHRMRHVELLAIDDVHFLASKAKTQSEFLHTLDAVDLTGARVVLASDEHPRLIQKLNQSLVSRFMAGMVVRIERPERALRLAIIQQLAQDRGMTLVDSVAEAIADRCISSVREIQGALTKLSAIQSALLNAHSGRPAGTSAGPIGGITAGRLFGDSAPAPGRPVPVDVIVQQVCARLGVSQQELTGSARHHRIVLARRLTAYLCRTMTTRSFPEIARDMGVSSHSSIHNADAALRSLLKNDARVNLPDAEMPVRLCDLVDQLRHDVLRWLAENRKG